MAEYTQENNLLGDHRHWHERPANGSGGDHGRGSGEPFIQYHSNLMVGFLQKLKTDSALFEKLNGRQPKISVKGVVVELTIEPYDYMILERSS